MADLIDRQAAISEIEEYADRLQMVNWKENPGVPYKVHALNWCVNTIRDFPPTDAVEVVRCKDCKHRWVNEHYGEKGYMKIKAMCSLDTDDPFELGRNAYDDNWFCADGERKDG